MKERRKTSASPERLRKRAEQLLATTRRKVAQIPMDDMQRLVQELEIHQIELEMQNEELRRTQLELETARDHYAGLYDFAPSALLTLNARGEILEANLSAGELLGLDRDRLMHQRFTRFVPAEAQDTFYLLCERVFSSDGRQSAELDLVNAQAKRLVVHVEALGEATSPRNQGQFIFTDITERKQVEAALQAREAQLYSFVQQAPAAIAMFDRNMNYLAASQRWTNDSGRGHRDLVGLNLYDVSPDLPDGWKEIHRKCQAGETHSNDEDLWMQMDGRRLWLRWAVRPWLDAHGNIGGIMIMAEDITARKNAEAALHESEERLRFALETIHTGAWDLDLVDHTAFHSIEHDRIFGYAELLPEWTYEMFLEHVLPEDRAAVDDKFRQAIESKGDWNFECRIRRTDGEVRWIWAAGRHRQDVAGAPRHLAGIVQDITERKRAEEHIAQLNRTQSVLAGVDHAIVHLSDRQKLLDKVCRVAVEKGGFKLAWIGMVAPDGAVQPVAQAGMTGYLEGIRVVIRDEPEGHGPVGTAIRGNWPVVSEDIERDERMIPWRDRAGKFGLNYIAAFPLRIAGKVAGAFQVYAPRAGFYNESELGLLTQVSDDISFALTAMADLAARKQAEEALAESEKQYRNLFDTMIEGFCIIEVVFDARSRPIDYRFLEVNPAFEKQTGLHNVQGKLMRDLAPDIEARWFDVYGKIAMTGEPARFVNEARALNRWFDVSAFRLGGTESRKVAILFNDVTEAKRAEVALRESERCERERAAELAALLDAMPTPVFIAHDPECLHITGNHAADELLRNPRGAEASLTAPEATKPRHFRAVKDGRELRDDELPSQQAARGFPVDNFEFSFVFDDGTTRDMLAYGTPLRDDKGRPRGAVNVLVDITALKLAENALRTSERSLRTLTRALEQSPSSVLITSTSGEIEYVNPKFTEITGYSLNEVLGKNPRLLKSGQQPPEFYKEMWATITAGRDWRGELCNRKKDGTLFWEFVVIAPIHDEHGTITHFVALKEDITERRRLEFELLEVTDREQQRIGHDLHDGLGQRLTALEMKCFLLMEDMAADERAARRRKLHNQAQHISQALRECITVTRSIAHGLAPVILKTEGLMGALEQLAQRTRVPGKLECRFVFRNPVALDDFQAAKQLYRIAQEAVNNALKHARTRRIRISLTHTKGKLRLQIKDEGRGLPKSRKSKSGMGMEVMHHRAHVIGATLEIDSKSGKGVSVTCTLPLENHEN